LKDAGLKRGETVAVKAGKVIGKVGNFEKSKAGGTTAHLHFEIRRGDNIGKPLSPYLTLIRAYERLIGATGTEITD
jgi:murein DD-endopeptidase MepM/ murein hydrolase activator NlpD